MKSIKKILLLFFCSGLFWSFHLEAQNSKLQLRLENTCKIVYHSDEVEVHPINLDHAKADVKQKLQKDRVYRITDADDFVGYAYVGYAPSKEREFDYLLVFNPELTIKTGKILIYRETFGREIDSPRWLKQFEGMSPASTFKFGEDIDGISGATISARSMTHAVQKALKNMGLLNDNKLL